jgi:hypothetical protein
MLCTAMTVDMGTAMDMDVSLIMAMADRSNLGLHGPTFSSGQGRDFSQTIPA